MHVTDYTERPRVSEIMQMPHSHFRHAQVGYTVTLGARLPEIEAQRSGDESAPTIGKRYRQIRAQLESMAHSGYL